MSDASSTPVGFVALPDAESAASAEPSLLRSFCGTRGRTIRCVAVLLIVAGLVAVACYFNLTQRASKPGDDEVKAYCDQWVNRYHLLPDAAADCPISTSLRVKYNGSAVPFAAHFNGTCSPLTSRPPSVELPVVQANHSYAFALLDVDFPDASNVSLRARTHYLVVNIPGRMSPLPLHLGDTLFNYSVPCPPTPGPHRYVALVYDQNTVNNASLASRNISAVPPVLMNIDTFMSLLVGFDATQSMLGGTFWYGQNGIRPPTERA